MGLRDIVIVYRAGKENTIADALSHNPQAPILPEQDTEQDIQVAQVLGSKQEESGDGFLQLLQLDPSLDDQEYIEPPLAEEQCRDNSLRPLIQYLEDSQLPDNPALAQKIAAQSTQFTLLGGIHYFIDQKNNSRKRAVVPVQLRTTLIEGVHGGPLARHFSSQLSSTPSHVPGGGKECTRMYTITVRVAHSVPWLWEEAYPGDHHSSQYQ